MRAGPDTFFRVIRPVATLSLLVVVCLSVAADGGAEAPEVGAAPPEPMRDAHDLFTHRCARCHDGDGTGASLRTTLRALPDFTSVRWHQAHPTAQLEVSILDGKGTHMPAFSGRITRRQARALADYIRNCAPLAEVPDSDQAARDFNNRFRDLQVEFERLRKQFQELRSAAE